MLVYITTKECFKWKLVYLNWITLLEQKKLEVKIEYEKTNQELELENIEKTKQKILNLKKRY